MRGTTTMIKELISVYANGRFWLFMGIAFLPVWAGLIGTTYLLIKGKIDEILQRR